MNKVGQFLEEKVMPVAAKIAEQKHLTAIRDGLILGIPILIVGSIILILANFPVTGYPEFMASIFGEFWRQPLVIIYDATFAFYGVFSCLGIAFRLAEKYKIDALSTAVIALSCFVIQLPDHHNTWSISLSFTGAGVLFLALLTAIVTVEICRLVIKKGIVIRMPDGVPPSVSRSFVALIPAAFSILAAILIRIAVSFTAYGDLNSMITQIISAPLANLGASLFGVIISVLMIHLLWSLGLHGAMIVESVMLAIWMDLMGKNLAAYQAGQAIPYVVTKQFFDMWLYIGGSGATLALVCLMAFRARSKQVKTLGRMALPAGIFNINEPVIFGLPIVMNPTIAIPFILTPVVLAVITYFAMSTGIVARPAGLAVPWTAPFIMSGFLATGGKISGVALQIFNFIIAGLIYLPFFSVWDKKKLEEEQQASTAANSKTLSA